VALQLVHEVAVLAIAEPMHALHIRAVVGCALWHIDASRFQECGDAIVTRLAIDVPSVVRHDIEGNERLTGGVRAAFEKRIEQLLPRCRVDAGRLSQHAIHIEQNRVVLARRQGGNRTRAAHARPSSIFGLLLYPQATACTNCTHVFNVPAAELTQRIDQSSAQS